MKHLAILLTLIAMAAWFAGCDKPEPDGPITKYDKSVDGSIPLPTPPSGQSILKGTGLPYTPPPMPAAATRPAAGPATAPAAEGLPEPVNTKQGPAPATDQPAIDQPATAPSDQAPAAPAQGGGSGDSPIEMQLRARRPWQP